MCEIKMFRFVENRSERNKKLENNFVDPNTVFYGIILVLVPHMDDEILGCGGTIAQLINKELIYFVFASDGSKSPYSKKSANSELNKIRVNESKSALSLLGIPEKNIIFLNLPDYQLKNYFDTLADKLAKIIKELKPDIILTPFRYDRHPDHIVLRNSTLKAYILANSTALIFEYFVYTKVQLLKHKDIRKYIYPDLLIRINTSNVITIKRRALSCFKSQTTNCFENQYHPVLSEDFLENNCHLPEVFLRTNPKSAEPVFIISQKIILIINYIEPFLKRKKDNFFSFIYKFRKIYVSGIHKNL